MVSFANSVDSTVKGEEEDKSEKMNLGMLKQGYLYLAFVENPFAVENEQVEVEIVTEFDPCLSVSLCGEKNKDERFHSAERLQKKESKVNEWYLYSINTLDGESKDSYLDADTLSRIYLNLSNGDFAVYDTEDTFFGNYDVKYKFSTNILSEGKIEFNEKGQTENRIEMLHRAGAVIDNLITEKCKFTLFNLDNILGLTTTKYVSIFKRKIKDKNPEQEPIEIVYDPTSVVKTESKGLLNSIRSKIFR